MSNPIPTDARQAVYERERYACIRCGMTGAEIHHRKRRREGGHGLENMILLCSGCHRQAHANPAWARQQGLIVSVHANNVSEEPIRTYGGWFTLNADGTTTPHMKGTTP